MAQEQSRFAAAKAEALKLFKVSQRTKSRRHPADPIGNVIAVGAGPRIRHGRIRKEKTVHIYIESKLLLAEIPEEFRLPSRVLGLPTDVIELGPISKTRPDSANEAFATPIRPVHPGLSIAACNSGGCAGAVALGAVTKRGDKRFILSCNHDLSDGDNGQSVHQPSKIGLGNEIGEVLEHLPLVDGVEVDAALVALSVEALPQFPTFGRLSSSSPIAPSELAPVVMDGPKHINSQGVIVDDSCDGCLPGANDVYMKKQIIIYREDDEFAGPGDSGSVVIDRRSAQATGLLWGYSITRWGGGYGYAGRISIALDELAVELEV